MSVLVTTNFDDDSIKNERASMETAFSHYKSMGIFFRRSRAANSVVSGGGILFPTIRQWGLSVAMETRVLIQSAPKPYAAFHPPQ